MGEHCWGQICLSFLRKEKKDLPNKVIIYRMSIVHYLLLKEEE